MGLSELECRFYREAPLFQENTSCLTCHLKHGKIMLGTLFSNIWIMSACLRPKDIRFSCGKIWALGSKDLAPTFTSKKPWESHLVFLSPCIVRPGSWKLLRFGNSMLSMVQNWFQVLLLCDRSLMMSSFLPWFLPLKFTALMISTIISYSALDG